MLTLCLSSRLSLGRTWLGRKKQHQLRPRNLGGSASKPPRPSTRNWRALRRAKSLRGSFPSLRDRPGCLLLFFSQGFLLSLQAIFTWATSRPRSLMLTTRKCITANSSSALMIPTQPRRVYAPSNPCSIYIPRTDPVLTLLGWFRPISLTAFSQI